MFEANPILRREVRARWRRWPAFAIVFGYAALLAVSVGLLYAAAIPPIEANGYPSRAMATVGHDLFQGLTLCQIIGWLLLAPALTAPDLASERERGMLDLLQMTPLSPARIRNGKLLSALAFLMLLMLAPLPITALCFLMGGVSPGEFGAMFVLQAATAATCAVIGLFASAWTRRPSSALGLAFGITGVWAVGSFVVFIIADSYGFRASGSSSWLWDAVKGVYHINPLLAIFPEPRFAVSLRGELVPEWTLCVAFEAILSLALLISTARALRQPLGEGEPPDETAAPPRRFGWRRKAQPNGVRPGAWREAAWTARVRCANPVLQRELQRRLRWRRPARWVVALGRLAAVLAGAGYLRLWIYILEEGGSHHYVVADTFWIISAIGLLGVGLMAVTLGAVGFARERETGTWEGIRLSLLRPGTIIAGKLLPPLALCLALATLFWLPLLPCVAWSRDKIEWGHVVPEQASAVLVIAGATVWGCLCWGLGVSWWFRRTWTAVVTTLASLLVTLLFVPMLLLVGWSRSEDVLFNFLRFWHPAFALITISDRYLMERYHLTPSSVVIGFALTQFILGALWLGWLRREMAHNLRQAERANVWQRPLHPSVES